jgi:hypothetical protein
MPRPSRFVPEHSLVEITTRTFQGRTLIRPSPELTDIILGIIGKAQELYGMTIHAFGLLGIHAHFLLSPTSAGQLALFMQFANAHVANEAGRLHLLRERFWSRRYRSIVVADDNVAHARTHALRTGPCRNEVDRFHDKTAIHQASVGLVDRHLGSRSSTFLENSGTTLRAPDRGALGPAPRLARCKRRLASVSGIVVA